MSLINQVLKDLDQQRGPADGLQFAALQGIGLVQGRQSRWPAILTAGALVLALALAGFSLFRSAGSWTTQEAAIEISPAPVTVTAANAQPETLEPIPEVVAAPVIPLAMEPAGPAAYVSTAVVTDEIPVTAPVEQAPTRPMKTLSARQHAEHAFAAAQKALGRHDTARAEQLFNSALDYQPQHTDARIQLAALYLERSKSATAERVLEEGLLLDPTQAQLARLYAQLLATKGEFDRALQALAPVIDARSPDAEILALRAAVYARLSNYEDAVSDYRLALDIDSGRATWWMGLGLALEHLEIYSGAADAYQKADSLPLADNVKPFVRQRLEQLETTAGDR